MKFRLSRQLNDPMLSTLIAREMRKQGLGLSRITATHLQEIAHISKLIEKDGLPKYLICKKLPHNLGSGLFLHPKAETIPRGHVIAPYAGIPAIFPTTNAEGGLYAFSPLENFYLTKEEQTHFDKTHRFHPRRRYSLFIDAEKQGNFSRFVNHSSTPNIEARLIKVSANPYGLPPCPLEVVYFTKKAIHPGEQLLVCYEGEENCYWDACGIKPFHMTPKTFQLNDKLVLQENS